MFHHCWILLKNYLELVYITVSYVLHKSLSAHVIIRAGLRKSVLQALHKSVSFVYSR